MPVPPWFVRILPGIGMAATAGYVGYKIWEHLEKVERERQEQIVQAEEEEIALRSFHEEESSAVGETDNDGNRDYRSALCASLELSPPNSLDEIPEDRLTLCLEALSHIPVESRPAFITLFCEKLVEDEQVEHFIRLMESLNSEYQERAIQLLANPELWNVAVFFQALELCPLEQRHDFLDRLYVISIFSHLNVILWQFERWNNDDTHTFQLVEAITRLPDDSPITSVAFVTVLSRISRLANTHEGSIGLLRALRLGDNDHMDPLLERFQQLLEEQLQQVTQCLAQVPDEQVIAMIQNLCGDDTLVQLLSRLATSTEHREGFLKAHRLAENGLRDPLLQKLIGLPEERLQQVTLCFYRFPDTHVLSMIRTLCSSNGGN